MILMLALLLSSKDTWLERIYLCERAPAAVSGEVLPPESFEMTFQQKGDRLSGFQMSDAPDWLNGAAVGRITHGKY
ncbi:MAG: hypothetical protein LC656_07690, partial [Sphingomonadales bacterium]|nr:hypothetical protein [Sphingomonadales bacterium]